MHTGKKIVVIGSGFAGLSAACFMAKAGWQVTVLEKNETPGGRARQLKSDGFTFDMGPSWYWMPEIFERFFQQFSKNAESYYLLKRLDPSYRIYWPDESMDIPAGYVHLRELFEKTETGSAKQLDSLLREAAFKYNTGMKKLVFKPGRSVAEFLDKDLLTGIIRLDVFSSMKKHIAGYFRNSKIQQLLEFPVLFLGALPEKTPALYSLMNYADIHGGTWYPEGGIYSVINAMYRLALELNVRFRFSEQVTSIEVAGRKAKTVHTSTPGDKAGYHMADVVLSGADYHHTETRLLEKAHKTYSDAYWDTRVMAPSCLIYYVGLNKKLSGLTHHSLFFDTSFEVHGREIYTTNTWPSDPLFYVCAPSVTDDTVAPPGCENLFFLVPVASGLEGDTEALREHYFQNIVKRFENRIGSSITDAIIFKKTYAHSDFVNDYNAFKGNAYGLANTLMQTAILKPACRSRKVSNLFYTGQLTVPGPGVPPSLISGEVVAKEIIKYFG